MIAISRWRQIFLLLLWTICSSAMAFSTRTERWSEDAVLSNGREVKVEREVGYTFQFISGDEASMKLFASWPDKFWIRFKHPDTGETITWQGEQYYNPILLDFVNGIPYLVVNGQSSKKTEAVYGCPELPYIYLKYESGLLGKWSPVPSAKAPDVLRKANLSPDYPDFGKLDAQDEAIQAKRRGGRARRDMSPDDIQKRMSKVERGSAGFFQRVIPRNYEEWNYTYKNSHLNERRRDDCRPPRALPPQEALPAPIEGSPEILKEVNYTPDRISLGDDWSTLTYDPKRESGCKALFRPTDPNDYMKGQRFINDRTGDKPAPYSRTAQFNMGVRVLCDEHVWFLTHQEEPGKIVISKFTVTGDLVYRTSFRNPDRVEGFIGYIRVPSLRSRDGYLYFDWLDFRDINREWHIKRWLEMRMREPEMPNPAVQGTLRDKAAQRP
ncbi:hypothetical protein CF120_15110 [Aeromonas allosaccharophila]|jgi:hypothetical protein|nr:hypothetical protein CF120_15110 [Aeromonas allosaccharophila]